MQPETLNLPLFVIFVILIVIASGKCMYDMRQSDLMPVHTQSDPFPLKNLTACKDYIEPGRLGCCSRINDQLTIDNFKTIDGFFGSQGGGCDICAINLKRFWCEYACSARQDEFMWTAKELKPYPDPEKPGEQIMGQEVFVRVHTETACKIYNSCKRVPNVATVSAMSNTAAFFNFQGHNALDQSHQYITMNFSININDSLAFSDSLDDFAYADVQTCDYKTSEPELHNFTFSSNCTCNTCDEACDSNGGFKYYPADVLEGFNVKLVGGVYIFVGVVVTALTIFRTMKAKKLKRSVE